jgi:hypothetical protein
VISALALRYQKGKTLQTLASRGTGQGFPQFRRPTKPSTLVCLAQRRL